MSRQVRYLYEFGPFRLDPEKPCLWRDGEPVSLTPKAVETLLVLVQQNGKLVEREDLMKAIWPNTFVEDGNLNFNVSILRKALGTDEAGEQYIQTVPRHGYRFTANVREVTEDVPALIVEKHTRSRVVIEERDALPPAQLAAAPWPKRRWYYLGAALVFTAGLIWFFSNRPDPANPTSPAKINAIAVLPLRPLGDGQADRTLSLGLTDTLVTRMGSLRSIVVRPVLTAPGKSDPVQMGRELKVDAVLEATLQRLDNRIRINARLLRVADGALIWSSSFDEDEIDLFKLQDALAIKVTESLISTLDQSDRELLTRHDTEVRDAFHAYWLGRFFLDKRNPEKAIPEFQRAIDLDAKYARAYAGLADAYTTQAGVTSDKDLELYEKARALTNQALALDPTLADAHTSLAQLKYYRDWDWKGAQESFKRALELDPGSVTAHQFYGRLLATLGRYDEAIAEIQKARELDPRSPDLLVPLFAVLEKRGDFDEALKVLHTSLEMDSELPIAWRAVGKIYLIKEEYAKVIELANERFPNLKAVDLFWASMLATAYQKTGQEARASEMRALLLKLAEEDSKALYFLAMHDSEMGRWNEAITALERCLKLREDRMVWTKDEPRFASMKDHPRFREILKKLNLT